MNNHYRCKLCEEIFDIPDKEDKKAVKAFRRGVCAPCMEELDGAMEEYRDKMMQSRKYKNKRL